MHALLDMFADPSAHFSHTLSFLSDFMRPPRHSQLDQARAIRLPGWLHCGNRGLQGGLQSRGDQAVHMSGCREWTGCLGSADKH